MRAIYFSGRAADSLGVFVYEDHSLQQFLHFGQVAGRAFRVRPVDGES